MNLPNKITIFRIGLSFVIVAILLIPFDAMGIELPKLFVNEALVMDTKYLVAGALFIIASITDLIDGFLARKLHMETDFGKMLDAIADKVLVNSVLVILASQGFIHPILPVVIIVRDIITDAIKMSAANKGRVVSAIGSGKIKTVCLMVGIILTLFYNMPFELWNFRVSDFLLVLATILSIISAFQYYYMNKDYILNEEVDIFE